MTSRSLSSGDEAFAGGTRPVIRPHGSIYGAQTTPADIPGAISHTFFTLERLPKDVGAPGIWTLANVAKEGNSMLVMVNNRSGDVRDRQVLAFEDPWRNAEIARLGDDGRPVPLGRVSSRWQIPFVLGQMQPEYLLVTRSDE